MTHGRLLVALLPLLLACAVDCQRTPREPAPAPTVAPVASSVPPSEPVTPSPVEPEAGAKQRPCVAACDNLERLGWCNALPHRMTCIEACERLNGQVDSNGDPMPALNAECIAAAESCDAFRKCD